MYRAVLIPSPVNIPGYIPPGCGDVAPPLWFLAVHPYTEWTAGNNAAPLFQNLKGEIFMDTVYAVFYSDDERIELVRAENGRWFNHYGVTVDKGGRKHHASTAGPFSSYFTAEDAVKLHRPHARNKLFIAPES